MLQPAAHESKDSEGGNAAPALLTPSETTSRVVFCGSKAQDHAVPLGRETQQLLMLQAHGSRISSYSSAYKPQHHTAATYDKPKTNSAVHTHAWHVPSQNP